MIISGNKLQMEKEKESHNDNVSQTEYIGNSKEFRIEQNDLKIRIVGNSNRIRINTNNGSLEVIGNSTNVQIIQNNGKVKYIGNSGKVCVGRESKKINMHYIGNNGHLKVVNHNKLVEHFQKESEKRRLRKETEKKRSQSTPSSPTSVNCRTKKCDLPSYCVCDLNDKFFNFNISMPNIN